MRSRGWPGWCRRCCTRISFGFIILSELVFSFFFGLWGKGRGAERGGGGGVGWSVWLID